MQDKFLFRTLSEFGLNDNEIFVYLEAIKHETCSPFSISKATGIPRTTVYDVVMGLSLKGLLKVKQSNGFDKQQTIISAENPGKLREIIRARRAKLANYEIDLINAISIMKTDYFGHDQESSTLFQIYEGVEGFKKLYLDYERLKSSVDVYAWDSFLPADTFGTEVMDKDCDMTIEMAKKYPAVRKELVSIDPRSRSSIVYQYRRNPDYFRYLEHRYIENPVFALFNRVEIRGDYVYFFSNQRDEIYGLVMKSANLAASFKSIYLLQWQAALPITETVLNEWGKLVV